MDKEQQKILEIVISAMVIIYDQLKETRIRDYTGENLKFLYINNTSLSEEQQKARQLMDHTIKYLTEANPFISKRLIYDRLLFGIVQQALYFVGDKHNVRSEIEQGTKELLDYRPQRNIDIPIIFLDPGLEPIKFGLTTFYTITDKDWDEGWLSNTKVDYQGMLTCYARVIAVGDLIKSKDNADQIVNDMLTYLRAVGFPISTEPQIQFGILNNYPPSQSRPYRSGRPLGKYIKLEGDFSYSWKLGPGLIAYSIQNLLRAIDLPTLTKLQALIESDYRVPKTKMRSKFLLGLHWLGESTKPDSTTARFAKLAISLEALLGGESKQDLLSTRRLKATLAERGAFIAGDNAKDRIQLYKAISKFYGFRSYIVHGDNIQISEQDLIDFAFLVRKITWSLLNKLDDFSDIDHLQEWIIQQRYS